MSPHVVRRLARGVPALALMACVLPWGLVQYGRSFARVPELAGVSMAERRPLVLGEWYREAEEVRAATEPGTPIDLVIRSEGDLLFAEMAETGLHLRDCRTFAGWEAWRRRERIRFHPDPRSVNQAPGPPPGPAQLVLAVRPDLGRLIEVVTPPQ